MRFYSRLKEEQAGRSVRIGSHFHTFGSNRARHLVRTRNDITQEFERTADAHVTTGAYTEYREHTADNQTGTDTGTHIIFTQCAFFKEFFHQHIVVFGGSLDQCFVEFHCFIHFFCGDFQYIGNSAFRLPTIHFHLQHVDNGIEGCTCRNRILDGYNLASPLVAELGDRSIIISLIVIQLVHDKDNRLMELFCIPELVDCADFYAILRIQYHQCRVCHIQSGNCTADKIVRTRTINEIQLSVLPFYTENGREYRVTILLLNREIIAHSVSGFHTSATFYNSTLVKHSFSESGFPRARTSQDRDVLNFICLVYFHDIKVLICV